MLPHPKPSEINGYTIGEKLGSGLTAEVWVGIKN